MGIFDRFRSRTKEDIKTGKHPEEECLDFRHNDCGGYRLDTRSSLQELGAVNIPDVMESVPDGKVIIETFCSCSCHDRSKLKNTDEDAFYYAYVQTLDIWGTTIRYGSEREQQDLAFKKSNS